MVKSITNICFGLIILFLVNGCEPPEPYAAFEPNSYSVGVNSAVYFYNYSREASSYEWDFGDGFTSTEDSPEHIYSDTGEFTVTLTAYNSNKSKFDKFEAKVFITPPQIVLYGTEFSSLPSTNLDGTSIASSTHFLFNIYFKGDTIYKYPNPVSLDYVPIFLNFSSQNFNKNNLVIDKFNQDYKLEVISVEFPSTYNVLDTLNFGFDFEQSNLENQFHFSNNRGTNIIFRKS